MATVNYSDLLAQTTLRDPLSFYAQLRESEPLAFFTFGSLKVLVIAGAYEETAEYLKDPRFVKEARHALPGETAQAFSQYGEVLQLLMQNMLAMDPPDHTRLRGFVSRAFTPRMIEQLRPRIQQITDELLDAVEGRGEMDIVADFAYPLPMTVICEMLGISPDDRARFRAWTQELFQAFSAPGKEAEAVAVGETFISYIRSMLVSKRARPGNDLISALLQVEEQGDKLSEDELVSMVWLLIVAGHETTVNLLSNGTLALLQHPEQVQLLHQNPELITSAVEELLRYAAPVLFAGARWASEDIPFRGQIIPKGTMVRFSSVSANTDPQHFANPQGLDIAREENKHLAFGRGIHACLGAPLARLEGQIAFGTLFRRFPNLRLACTPEQLNWSAIANLRSLQSLPVSF